MAEDTISSIQPRNVLSALGKKGFPLKSCFVMPHAPTAGMQEKWKTLDDTSSSLIHEGWSVESRIQPYVTILTKSEIFMTMIDGILKLYVDQQKL